MLSCKISLANKPVGTIFGAQFTLIVELDATTDLLHQMMAVDRMVDGYVRFFKRDGMSKLYDYEFRDCFIAKYKVHFSSTTTEPTTLELLFSPGILRIGDAIHKKPWHITNLEAEAVEPTPDPGMAPDAKLLNYYFEDENNEVVEQKKIRAGQRITLVIVSEHANGEQVTIELNDEHLDFEYKGDRLENDVLADVSLTGNKTRIDLKAIVQE